MPTAPPASGWWQEASCKARAIAGTAQPAVEAPLWPCRGGGMWQVGLLNPILAACPSCGCPAGHVAAGMVDPLLSREQNQAGQKEAVG